METQEQITTKIVLDSWYSRIDSADKLFNGLTDDQLLQEIAPGKNRGVYLLGHLIAVHDKMLPLLDFGPQMYPQLNDPFLAKPDKSVAEILSVQELREYWNATNVKLTAHFNTLQAEEWFQKHTSVTTEEFINEPHRNRLNVILSRTNHLSYHLGQIALLKK